MTDTAQRLKELREERETTTFLECAARLEAMVKPGQKSTITIQQLADTVQEIAHQQIALFRYLDKEFPNADKIRQAVFQIEPAKAEFTTPKRLKELRRERGDLEWEIAAAERQNAPQSEIDALFQRHANMTREITRLSEYERLGYDEPNF